MMMMKRGLIAVIVLGGLCGVSTFAGTYVAGMKDVAPGATSEGLGDFNDLIISLSAAGLNLVSADGGSWSAFSSSIVNENQTYPATNADPFWDNTSLDDTPGSPKNIGYCLTTDNCGLGGSSSSPVDGVNQFLHGASGQGSTDNNFYFSFSGSVTTVDLAAFADGLTSTESLGWYTLGSPGVGGVIIPIGAAGTGLTYNFTPSTNFGLWFYADGNYYFTDNAYDTVSASRFALFTAGPSSSVPEPGTMALFGLGAVALGIIPRLRKRRG
jgi:hypothetical protein